ncbi:DUF6318 family protein [Modestobacter sp. Leaf380]|uniref:DUF6318 family protein n=1 Tax=Modestobacter sp. Leaf380 TaxID=1736356 RepID=UPI00070090A8|nr:DUF6318 family protein [Modestobacter sp. Leaf380]KQS68783.1 hypothetical protein ASG41_07695 [Modestobacter sp. Leaf380]
MLLVAVVGAVLVSGCTAETPANDTLPTASEGAESSAELEPLGPADLPMPVEARERTPAGAEAFVEYYVALINASQVSLQSDFIRQLSAECTTCRRLADGVDYFSAQGFRYDGGAITINALSLPTAILDTMDFSVDLSQAQVRVLDGTGAEVPAYTAAESRYGSSGGQLTWASALDSWTVSDLTIE